MVIDRRDTFRHGVIYIYNKKIPSHLASSLGSSRHPIRSLLKFEIHCWSAGCRESRGTVDAGTGGGGCAGTEECGGAGTSGAGSSGM